MTTSDYDPLAAYSTPTLTERIRKLTANNGVVANLFLVLSLIAATLLL